MVEVLLRILYALLGVLVIIFIARLIAVWAEKKNYEYVKAIAKWIEKAGIISAILFAVYALLPIIPMPPDIFNFVKAVVIGISIVVIGYLISLLIEDLARIYFTARGVDAFMTSLPYIIIRTVVMTLVIMIAMEKIGIPIAPILTTLGVGGLAIAFAMQDILSNIVAGIILIFGKQIRPGDFVSVSSDITGVVEDINIRNTIVRRPFDGAMVIVPNKTMANSAVVNFQKDADGVYGIALTVGVSYDTDLDQAIEIAKKVAEEVVAEVDEAYKDFEPVVRVDEMGDSAINLKILMKSNTLAGRFKLTDLFYRKIKKAYEEAGIEIPYPKQDIYIKEMPKA